MKRSGREESGAALIAVLSILLVISLLVASSLTISQITSYISAETSNRVTSAYSAEGAGARILWLLMKDKENNPERELGAEKKEEEGEEGEERFLADGTKHSFTFNDMEVEVAIYDMASGTDVSGQNPAEKLKKTEEDFKDLEESYEDYQEFLDCLSDYIDSDPFVRLNGAEKNEYAEQKKPLLPRNRPLQFREELLWVQKATDFFKPDENGIFSEVQIIPLKGMQKIVGKKSIFSVSKNELMKDCGMTPEEAASVIEAREKWEKDKELLSENLDENIMEKLKGKYSFKESGFYTFIVRVKPAFGKSERKLTFSMKVDSRMNGKNYRYYDWKIF